MIFEKKLIILSGSGGAKGTLTLERNAYGVFALLTVYNLPDLSNGEYIVGLRSTEGTYRRPLGSAGRISAKFQIEPDIPISAVHCVIFDSVRYEPLLYGTNTAQKLWRGNMMDGLKEKTDATPKTADTPQNSLPSYSGRQPQVKDYFFDILPGQRIEMPPRERDPLYLSPPDEESEERERTDEEREESDEEKETPGRSLRESGEELLESAREIAAYNDAALAEVNYYDAGRAFTYSLLSDIDSDEVLNPIDKAETKAPPPRQEPMVGQRSLRGGQKEPAAAKSPRAFTVPPASSYSAGAAAGSERTQSIFYDRVKDQIEELFSAGERFRLLEDLMEETRWVKVVYDEPGRYYAVGLAGPGPAYICYAVPAAYTPNPPPELGENCRWLPQKPEEPEGNGFWLMFQDALNGEAV